jgi:tetratricopeptide (TPR) repeat protein
MRISPLIVVTIPPLQRQSQVMGWLLSLVPPLNDWLERRRILREIERIADDEAVSLALDDNNLINLAEMALDLNDPALAVKHWRDALVRYPRFAKKDHKSLGILLRLNLVDEAEAIMRECMQLYPAEPFYAGGYAQIAEERDDYAEALKRWSDIRRQFPYWWKAHVHYAVALSRTGQSELAEKVLKAAIHHFPNEAIVYIDWARNAERMGNLEEALARWQTIWTKFKHAAADPNIGRVLEEMGRFEEAEAHMQEAKVRWPLTHEIRMTLARIALKRGDTEESLRRWAEVKNRFPLLRFGYEGELRLLRDLGRFDEAEAVIQQAKDRFPQETWPDGELQTIQRARQAAT